MACDRLLKSVLGNFLIKLSISLNALLLFSRVTHHGNVMVQWWVDGPAGANVVYGVAALFYFGV